MIIKLVTVTKKVRINPINFFEQDVEHLIYNYDKLDEKLEITTPMQTTITGPVM